MKQTWLTNINNFLHPSILTWALGLLVLILLYSAIRKVTLVIRRNEVGIMYNPQKGTFAGFRPRGFYLLVPGIHHLKGTISTKEKELQGRCEVHTLDGFPINLNWALKYRLNPGSIDPVLQPSMAKVLLASPIRMVEVQTIHCLGKIAGQHTLEALWRDGIHQKVNACSTRSVIECLAAYGIQIDEIKIGLVQWPKQNGTANPKASINRLGEGNLSRLAEPRPDLLNRVKSKEAQTHSFEPDSTSNLDEENAQRTDYYDAMARDIYQHAELSGDDSIGKLVV